MPADHPIIFSGSMVKALLAGTKTVTRRILKPQSMFDGREEIVRQFPNQRGIGWETGQRLWVREAFTTRNDGSVLCPRLVPMYAADFKGFNKPDRDWNWSPPIHMPRWVSRITLEVTGVKVELLQDITNSDAIAEGALESGLPYVGAMTCDQARVAFSLLWDGIHGKFAWEANPWVAAISFRRIDNV